jgi:hypothetical protein
MRAQIKKAFQDFRQHFNRSTLKDRHHTVAAIVYMARTYWKGRYHCQKIFTKFQGHQRVFLTLDHVREFLDHVLKHNFCPVHGSKLFNEKELTVLKNLLVLHDAVKADAKMEATLKYETEVDKLISKVDFV